MAIEIRNLRYIVALADRLNYSRAAGDLGISQPSLTRSVQVLEQQLGQRLFDRDRSGVSPTAHGALLIERARSLLGEITDFEQEAQLSAKGEGGSVRLGMAPLPARTLLPDVLKEQFVHAPRLSHDIVVRNFDELWQLLIADKIEFLVAAEGQVPENANIRHEVLGLFSVSPLVRAGHPLLEGDCPGKRFPILQSSRRGLSSELPEEFRDRVTPEVYIIEEFKTVIELLKASDAIWLTSPYALIDEIQRGEFRELRSSKGAPRREFRMMIYSLERRTPSPASRKFREALRRSMKHVAERWSHIQGA